MDKHRARGTGTLSVGIVNRTYQGRVIPWGGLFTLHALFNRTDDYDRYLVGSPSIWWDNAMLFEEEAAYVDGHEDMDADVFLSVGALEEGVNPEFDDSRMVSNAVDMAARLRAHGYPNLRLAEHVFEGETHLSVIPATMSRGLRALFAEDTLAMQAALARQAALASGEDG